KDHTADTIVHAKGADLKEAFEQAALGTYQVMTDISLIEHKITKEVSIKSEDEKSLLFDWIDQLIFLFDTEFFVSNKISIQEFSKSNDHFLLKATLEGEEFDINKHSQKSEVKAMTYSFMEVGENYVEFTLDL
ncbi:MAG: archease, partial [Candidatus Heimdallarchaeota archaeon]